MAEINPIQYDKILIRVINTTTQKVKNLFPAVVNNKGLMRNMGFVISDPNYDAKMECIKNKKPFSENGIAKEPVKESFAPIITEPVKINEPVIQPKNEIISPVIADEPKVKRTRRTKAQIESDKLTASNSTVTA